MDIKTLISLKQKIESLSFKLNNFNIFEKGFMFGLAISLFSGFLFVFLSTLSLLSEGFIFHSIFFLLGGIIGIITFLSLITSFIKYLSKNKTQLFKFLFSNLAEGFKFNYSKHIQDTLNSLTVEEIKLLEEIQLIKKSQQKAIINILEEKILNFAENASKNELNFILDSIENEKLRYKIFEISKDNLNNEINVPKKSIISI